MSTDQTGSLSLGLAEIDYQAENMVLFSVSLSKEILPQGEYYGIYMARLVGSDPVYGVRRIFQQAVVTRTEDSVVYEYLLSDGVYEVAHRRIRARDRSVVDTTRLLVFCLDGQQYVYQYKEVDKEYLLQSIYNFYLTQCDDTAWIMHTFFSNKGYQKHTLKSAENTANRFMCSIDE